MIAWLMMSFGIAMTADLAVSFLDPYALQRLLTVVAIICAIACVITTLAIGRIEQRVTVEPEHDHMPFMQGLREVRAETETRHFMLFIFLAMNACFMHESILEPYAGLVFGISDKCRDRQTAIGRPDPARISCRSEDVRS